MNLRLGNFGMGRLVARFPLGQLVGHVAPSARRKVVADFGDAAKSSRGLLSSSGWQPNR